MRELREAFHILGDYHAAHDLREVPILVDHLRDIIVKRGYVASIAFEKVQFPRKTLLGGIKFFDKPYNGGCHVAISYSSTLSKDWERVVACKEMCHAILDEDGERVTSEAQLMPHIEALHKRVLPTSAMQSEFLAEALAVELLMPLELRQHHLKAYRAGTLTDGELALRYWIPTYFVELAMSESYMEVVGKLRDQLVDITKR